MRTLVLCRESSFTGLFRCDMNPSVLLSHFDIFCQYCKFILTSAPGVLDDPRPARYGGHAVRRRRITGRRRRTGCGDRGHRGVPRAGGGGASHLRGIAPGGHHRAESYGTKSSGVTRVTPLFFYALGRLQRNAAAQMRSASVTPQPVIMAAPAPIGHSSRHTAAPASDAQAYTCLVKI